jgi:hypothetical protein
MAAVNPQCAECIKFYEVPEMISGTLFFPKTKEALSLPSFLFIPDCLLLKQSHH